MIQNNIFFNLKRINKKCIKDIKNKIKKIIFLKQLNNYKKLLCQITLILINLRRIL